MALHNHAVEAKEDRSIVIVRIEMMAQQFRRRARDQEAKLGSQRTGEGLAQEIGHKASRAFNRLQCNISGKSVRHYNVCLTTVALVGFDKTIKF